jgi:GntR family transcriptional regulator
VSANEDLGRTAEEVRQRILAQISAGQLRAGQKLGAERDLASEYQVSRSTLRIALTALEETGVVRRLPGRGGGTLSRRKKSTATFRKLLACHHFSEGKDLRLAQD